MSAIKNLVCWTAFFAILLFSEISEGFSDDQDSMSNSLEDSPILYLDAIAGGETLLPCDVQPPVADDASILVLFYREDKKTPIYSVDSRQSNLANGSHWNEDSINRRSLLKIRSKETGLLLKDVRISDSGLYKCRVDFEASPTRNSRMHLRVIEPPRSMSIFNTLEDGKEADEILGPYPVGTEIIISCQVLGGFPPPKLSWWHEGSLLDDLSEVRASGMLRNSLHLPKLTAKDLLKVITCQALNSNLTAPLTKTVTIDIAFPPSTIRILPTGSLSEEEIGEESSSASLTVSCVSGEECPLDCLVQGSRPPPIISWKSNGKSLQSRFSTISNPTGSKIEDTTSVFISTLILKPDRTYNKAMISCQAASPALRNQTVEANIKLDVLYPPRLKMSVKNHQDLNEIEENEEVVFDCEIDANPAVTTVQWTRNWVPLTQNLTSDILIEASGSRLILRRVSNKLSGHYTCAAANSQGSGTSNGIQLTVKFVPKCSPRQVTSIGVARSEVANVTCRVKSHPVATVFRWAFNTSEELIDIPFESQISKDSTSSTIAYQPNTPYDFGDLLCWASNSVGTMREPCLIKILPIDKPEGVRGCEIISNSTNSNRIIVIACIPGWDGGLAQTFTLEVRTAASVHARVLAALQRSSTPKFFLRNLKPQEKYLFTITSANARGTSPPATLTYNTSNEIIAGLANKRSNPKNYFMKLVPYIAVFVALIVVMTTCGSVIVCVVKSKAAKKAAADKFKVELENAYDAKKPSYKHSTLPPDRGKRDQDDWDRDSLTYKESSDGGFCAVHGSQERHENEYVTSYKSYFNSQTGATEQERLLRSSMCRDTELDNQKTTFPTNHDILAIRQSSKDNLSLNCRISCGSSRNSPCENITSCHRCPCERTKICRRSPCENTPNCCHSLSENIKNFCNSPCENTIGCCSFPSEHTENCLRPANEGQNSSNENPQNYVASIEGLNINSAAPLASQDSLSGVSSLSEYSNVTKKQEKTKDTLKILSEMPSPCKISSSVENPNYRSLRLPKFPLCESSPTQRHSPSSDCPERIGSPQKSSKDLNNKNANSLSSSNINYGNGLSNTLLNGRPQIGSETNLSNENDYLHSENRIPKKNFTPNGTILLNSNTVTNGDSPRIASSRTSPLSYPSTCSNLYTSTGTIIPSLPPPTISTHPILQLHLTKQNYNENLNHFVSRSNQLVTPNLSTDTPNHLISAPNHLIGASNHLLGAPNRLIDNLDNLVEDLNHLVNNSTNNTNNSIRNSKKVVGNSKPLFENSKQVVGNSKEVVGNSKRLFGNSNCLIMNNNNLIENSKHFISPKFPKEEIYSRESSV